MTLSPHFCYLTEVYSQWLNSVYTPPRSWPSPCFWRAVATYGVANSQSANGKYDTDGDGLIEIEYLEQLDAIRYDLDGFGSSSDSANLRPYATAFPISSHEAVCKSNCIGYELVRSLDSQQQPLSATQTGSPTLSCGFVQETDRKTHCLV